LAQDLRDIGQEQIGIDGAITDKRRDQAVLMQAGDEGRCLPVAVWGAVNQPRASLRTPAGADHVGLDGGFIDEEEPCRVQRELRFAPVLARLGDIGTGLLGGMQGLFLSVNASVARVLCISPVLAAI
jgi:hypothetical protein